MGARITGIIDREGGIIETAGLTFEQTTHLFNTKSNNKLVGENLKAPRPEPGLGKGSILFMAPDFDDPHEDMKGYME